MLTIAYLANEFPTPSEPYVADEIAALRARGVRVISGSVKRGRSKKATDEAEIVVLRLGVEHIVRAAWLLASGFGRLLPLIHRVVFGGNERISVRIKALLHTLLGACYAAQLHGSRLDHIHVHHGYFGSWVAMTAARLLNVPFSLSLHGSDLLMHGMYLDVKLAECVFCRTISEYNRDYILKSYPQVEPSRLVVSRLGVPVSDWSRVSASHGGERSKSLTILSVGRLHPVKDHAFLLQACAELRERGLPFTCYIAGEGPERPQLEWLIQKLRLRQQVRLLGQIAPDGLEMWYERADVVVLTSRSEGIPLVLMEAMAKGKVVLAPAITGLPELVLDGKSGYLYELGSMRDCVGHLMLIQFLLRAADGTDPEGCLDKIRRRAWEQVSQKFNREKNLESFVNFFLQRISSQTASHCDENSLLQQIQLPIQRNRSLPV